jgi:hypothetical protein
MLDFDPWQHHVIHMTWLVHHGMLFGGWVHWLFSITEAQ